jgi:hypothetical protein
LWQRIGKDKLQGSFALKNELRGCPERSEGMTDGVVLPQSKVPSTEWINGPEKLLGFVRHGPQYILFTTDSYAFAPALKCHEFAEPFHRFQVPL